MGWWKHSRLEQGEITFGRQRSRIRDGVFQAPERPKLEERLEELGHERCDEPEWAKPPEPEPAPKEPEDETPIEEQPVTKVKGIGPSRAEELAEHGIETVGDLASLDLKEHEDWADWINGARALYLDEDHPDHPDNEDGEE